MIIVNKLNESYNPVHGILSSALDIFIKRTGVHNGGDCAIIAKYIADYLDSIDEEYSFSGVLLDGEVAHILVKYDNKYYDGVEGEANTSGRKIADNLKDDGTAIGNDKHGWIDYKLGNSNYKSTKSYKLFNDIINEVA